MTMRTVGTATHDGVHTSLTGRMPPLQQRMDHCVNTLVHECVGVELPCVLSSVVAWFN